jgi:DNA (cytosine-5)-methyltransferase 1
MTPLTFGSLFAGIGGFDLGFERAGMQCKWQVEIDPYCQKVLAKHWPNVRKHDDVRTVDESFERVDAIIGGFPCQDISNAGLRAGIDGSRSGLWSEYVRIIRVLRPRFVIVENVAALLVRGFDRVLGDLASCGFNAEWQVLSAAAFGAPHIRERVFVIACNNGNAHSKCETEERTSSEQQQTSNTSRNRRKPSSKKVADSTSKRRREAGEFRCDQSQERIASGSEAISNTEGIGLEGIRTARQQITFTRLSKAEFERCRNGAREFWAIEPDVGRVANGIPKRVDRLRCLGNAIVPQVAEYVGRMIVNSVSAQDSV